MMKTTNFKLCPRRHEQQQPHQNHKGQSQNGESEKLSSSNGLCCNNIMHIKTGVHIIVYFEALLVTAFCTYVFTRIFISCCGMDFFLLVLLSIGFCGLTFLLYDGTKNDNTFKLKISLIFFIFRLIIFVPWSIMIGFVNILDLNDEDFEYFKEYMISRLSFTLGSAAYCIAAIIIIFKCHQFIVRLKIIATRGRQMVKVPLPCCQVTELTSSPYAINANNICPKHCHVLINRGASIQKSPISIRTTDSVNSETP